MSVAAWRIYKSKHATEAFSGEGARRYAGRWNSKGTAIIYTAGSPSLAVLELLVHLSAHELLQSYQLCKITFDESIVEQIRGRDLPRNWRADPAPIEARRIGDNWAASDSSAVLRVPSAIVDTEFNYLVNPAHLDFATIKIGTPTRFLFDPRLVK